MTQTKAVTEQTIVSFTSEGKHKSVGSAVHQINHELNAFLIQLRFEGKNPEVVSTSQSAGYIGHIGVYATITAVINN
jgi:hypothetical protein